MLVLVTYDVAITTQGGQKRLRKVADICENYGQRVQNSVFECILNSSQYLELKHQLVSIIDEKNDCLRFYRIGDNYQNKIEKFGVQIQYAQDDILVI